MQEELLQKHPESNVRVFTVWMPVLAGDASRSIDRGIVTDPRATNYWDSDRTVSRWFQESGRLGKGTEHGVLWDVYLLFEPGARWEDAPTGLVSWGGTILGARDRLAEALKPLVAAGPRS